MALKIRLWRQGCTNNVSYRIVVSDGRSPRDGKYLESIGHYNPLLGQGKQKIVLDGDRLHYWLQFGAEMTPTVASLAKQTAPAVLQVYAEKKQTQKIRKAAKRRAA